ncbi:OmpL47-type beta-barrel domain-containing protein [Streptomyces millisiae]|uniref:Family 16 glycoside hydrolase n=1 Tax=Streptomyces millisiae TaxID=3075542 RepID=A0ABU2LH69_9ACTN|nr:family 16 glycoside hydrolase [Streptomyces sp. DSM 44918]MDT0316931.1 family 16 glycoside hydrolase [Streptomyces sp. DSM 44918]
MTHGSTRAVAAARAATARRRLAVLLALCLAALALGTLPGARADQRPADGRDPAAQQVLTWTADNDITRYLSAPTTAVAGEATLVFENSAATGNTTGMPHTLTFDTSNPEYNNDVAVNIMANPNDANGGRYEVTVNLSPGTYRFFCAIPGHGQMQGELVVTEGGSGEDTTPPEATADVDGERNADGDYVGSATVTLAATDGGSGVDRIDYAVDGEDFTPYEAPIVLNTVGEHTVTYRATDKAGNVSADQTVTVRVVEPSGEDTTPPEVTATVDGERNADGDYVTMATVSLTATDDASGVAGIEYSLNGGAFTPYTAPVMVHSVGDHTVGYRATDNAGNSSATESVAFSVVPPDDPEEPGEPPADCPESDDRPLVMVGDEETGVPNRTAPDGCTINEVIEDERGWSSKGSFLTHVRTVTDRLYIAGMIDEDGQTRIREAAERSDVGEPGNRDGYERILTGTEQSLDRWAHVGGGAFELNDDGSVTSSTTVPGMGMLWFPEAQYGDFSLRLKFRDDAPGDASANSGVFVRFPRVHNHPEESRPEWVAIKYGHEVQIYDGRYGDQYKTGSVYGFDVVNRGEAMTVPGGVWNDYEIRVIDQHYWIYRNGLLINEFENAPGQLFSPPRADDPGTDGRQHDTGYIGLQTHGTSDVISFRDIRIRSL